jgi:hypothetical protein
LKSGAFQRRFFVRPHAEALKVQQTALDRRMILVEGIPA